MKHWWKRLLPGALALLLLAGCGRRTPTAADLLDPESPVYLTVWHYYNGAQLTAFNGLVDEFNRTRGKELGIVVEGFSHGSVTDLENNVLNAAEGNVGADEIPNMFAAYADNAYAIDQMGLAADLTEYLTQEELNRYVDSYIDEGRFSDDGSVKIFPLAKSVELFLLNKTDWEPFAQATGADYKDFSTIEGLVSTAQAYYEWTDQQTPEPNDGKAFFGRDAMANYLLIGAMQLGTEIFSVKNGEFHLDLNKETMRTLWDNYYIPYIKGYFAAAGRFRSDDVKTGTVLSFVGSSSGATFFPDQVISSDTESYPIEMDVFPCPQFSDSQPYAVQQGAGMVVTKGEPAEVYASIEFLKWITQDENNIEFSVDSGYLPVRKSANDMELIRAQKGEIKPVMEQILSVAVDTVNQNTLYTPKAFAGGSTGRAILEDAMSQTAVADRVVVKERLAQGESLGQATAEFTSDEYFTQWYQETLAQLEALTK